MKFTILTLCILSFLFTFSTQTFAVDFTVNTTNDLPDTNAGDGICLTTAGNCSLRAAVQEANALATNDRVMFNLPANSTIALTTGVSMGVSIFINPAGSLEIIGTGANNLTIDGSGGNISKTIFYTNLATMSISGVTLTGGFGTGGAIFASEGSLTLDSVRISGNRAFNFGAGGGVNFSRGGPHYIINSTFSENFAPNCGGIINGGGTLAIINSTISGNTASTRGGGLCNYGGTTTLYNVTITNNTAGTGGGIDQGGGPLIFGNTIVASNIAIGNIPQIGTYPEILFATGTITSIGGNLVGDSPGDSTNTGNPINYQPTDIRDTNPMLSILQNNGGTTPTHALLAGSPAIDFGLNALAVDPSNGDAPLVFDQRGTGFPRIVDGNGDGTTIVDIGAFEVQSGLSNTCTPTTTVTEGDLAPGGIVSFGISSGAGSVTVDHVNAGTGLQSLTVVGTPVNAVVNIPPFTSGTFHPETITFSAINPNQPVEFTLRAASTFHAANIRVRCGTPPNKPEK